MTVEGSATRRRHPRRDELMTMQASGDSPETCPTVPRCRTCHRRFQDLIDEGVVGQDRIGPETARTQCNATVLEVTSGRARASRASMSA